MSTASDHMTCPVAHAAAPTCPVRAPVDENFDPLSAEYLDDPYPILDQARERGPVFYAPAIDMWVITRYEDVDAAFRNLRAFSAAVGQQPVFELAPETKQILADGFDTISVMSDCDPPRHTRIRSLNVKGFSARRIAGLEPKVRAKAVELIEQIAPGKVDLVAALTYPLPAYMIFTFIGFPEEDTDMIKAWCGNRIEFSWGAPPVDEQTQVANNMVEYWQYCKRFVAHRKLHRSDDFTSYLLDEHDKDPDKISEHEIANVAYGLSFAGHETTTNFASNSIRQLLRHPDQWAEICADPSLATPAVEELLRFDSSIVAWRRVTTEDVVVADVTIPAKSKVLLLLGAADRDPEHFTEPTTLDIHRPDARNHLAFGKGIHYCIGAALARMEARIVLEELSQRAPGITLLPQDYAYPRNVSFRGPKTLDVQWPDRV